jgi:hypothetical protein
MKREFSFYFAHMHDTMMMKVTVSERTSEWMWCEKHLISLTLIHIHLTHRAFIHSFRYLTHETEIIKKKYKK